MVVQIDDAKIEAVTRQAMRLGKRRVEVSAGKKQIFPASAAEADRSATIDLTHQAGITRDRAGPQVLPTDLETPSAFEPSKPERQSAAEYPARFGGIETLERGVRRRCAISNRQR